MDVLVVGGGVIGCSIAYYLQRAGAQVVLAEGQRLASGASSAAAGMLAPLAESRDPGPFSHLALLGLKAFNAEAEQLIDESGVDFEFRRDGVLRIAESPEEVQALQERLAWQDDPGAEIRWLDTDAARAVEPLLTPGILGALYSPHDAHVNPGRLTAALATAAARRGARLLEGWAIDRFQLDGTRVIAASGPEGSLSADQIVLAGGAWLTRCAHSLGVDLSIFPVRGQMAALGRTPAPIRHIVYSHNGYLVPKADGSIYVGATEEDEAGFDYSVTAAGLRWLLEAAERIVPALASAAYLRSWAGLRPCAPDRLPILGPLPGFENVTLAAGHFRNGILLSLITGHLIADLLTAGVTALDLAPFSPSRFAR